MIVVPPVSPVTMPVPASMVPTAVLLLLHVPPVLLLPSAVVPPSQVPRLPVIGPGFGFTVTS